MTSATYALDGRWTRQARENPPIHLASQKIGVKLLPTPEAFRLTMFKTVDLVLVYLDPSK